MWKNKVDDMMEVHVLSIGIITMNNEIEVSLHINSDVIKSEVVKTRKDIKQVALKMIEEVDFGE